MGARVRDRDTTPPSLNHRLITSNRILAKAVGPFSLPSHLDGSSDDVDLEGVGLSVQGVLLEGVGHVLQLAQPRLLFFSVQRFRPSAQPEKQSKVW